MKKIAISIFTILLSFSVFAQSDKATEQATAATEKLTDFFKLETNQVAEIQTIQARKYRNLGEIENMKESDPTKYILKIRSIRTGTEASYKRVLNEEQTAVLNQKRMDNRLAISTNYNMMKKQNLTKTEMEEKIIEMELEMLENL